MALSALMLMMKYPVTAGWTMLLGEHPALPTLPHRSEGGNIRNVSTIVEKGNIPNEGEMISNEAEKKRTGLGLFSCKAPGDPCLSIIARATDLFQPNLPTKSLVFSFTIT